MDRRVLFLSSSTWDLPCRFRRHHFASHLAAHGWRVLFVEPIPTVTSALRTQGAKALRPATFASRVSHPEAGPGLAVYHPPAMLPFHVKSWSVGALDRHLLRRRLHRCARTFFETDSYLQVVNHPQDRRLLRGDLPILYDIMDRFSAYPEYRRFRASIEADSRTLVETADRITATTEGLAADVPAERRQVIPNGVDLAHYLALRDAPVPADLEALPAPRIVYVGALYQWFDFELVAALARRHADMSFVLIGFVHEALPELPPNVWYLGPRPWDALPPYLWHSDLGIIPFRENALTRDVDPLKLYEYLACGLPVVSTPMLALESRVAPGVLALASGADAFSDALVEGLDRRHDAETRRRAVAEAHDWSALARRFEAELDGIRQAP